MKKGIDQRTVGTAVHEPESGREQTYSKTSRCRIVVAGVPRSYQAPFADGRWLAERHVAAIESVSKAIDLVHISRAALESGEVPEPGADVLLVETCGRKLHKDEIPMPAFATLVTQRLRWLQSCSSGVGHILDMDLVPADVTITNAAGVHAAALAESAMAAILFQAKQLARRIENQHARRWEELRCFELRDKTVCIIGTGQIGTAIARRARPFGLETIGVRRNAGGADGFDRVFDRHHLLEALATADFVVVACPLTSETEGMIGSRELSAMKHGAYLINIARGRILQDQAMLAALDSGQLGGAFLDALDPEPLPVSHPYWGAPNVTVTPHDSHSSEYIGDNIVELFCNNLRRWLGDEPLSNRINRSRGY